jgi:hypothetical protein
LTQSKTLKLLDINLGSLKWTDSFPVFLSFLKWGERLYLRTDPMLRNETVSE